MRHLATFEGRRGEIVILEDLDTGARCYFEDGVFHSHATAHGISLFAYVHLMARVLRRANNVLLLGCAAGSLATMLHYLGKRVTVVDDNPLSFDIARQYFGLPDKVVRVEEDFRQFLQSNQTHFDGIGIDIGAPQMRFDDEFDAHTCRAVRSCLAPGGRVAMNIVVHHDLEPTPDRILTMLAGRDRSGWVYDRPGEIDRNAVLVATPTTLPCLGPPLDTGGYPVEEIEWRLRRQRRLRREGLMEQQTARILIADDHPLVRSGLRQVVASVVEDVEILESGDFEQVMHEFARNPKIDLVLLDLAMPGVREFSGLIDLRTLHPGVPVVVVSGNDERAVKRRCIELGAMGFITKSADIATMRVAIRQILAGETWVSPDVDRGASPDRETAKMLRRFASLTPQQARVLAKLSEGLQNRQIAQDLSIANSTVKSHISTVLRKLELHSRTQAVAAAAKIEAARNRTVAGQPRRNIS